MYPSSSIIFHHLPSSSSPFQPIPAHLLGVFAPEVGIDVVPEQRCGILVRLRALKVPKANELHLAKKTVASSQAEFLNGFTMVYHGLPYDIGRYHMPYGHMVYHGLLRHWLGRPHPQDHFDRWFQYVSMQWGARHMRKTCQNWAADTKCWSFNLNANSTALKLREKMWSLDAAFDPQISPSFSIFLHLSPSGSGSKPWYPWYLVNPKS